MSSEQTKTVYINLRKDLEQVKEYLLIKFSSAILKIQKKLKSTNYAIAGGSIANSVLNYYHKECPALINDIDVFIYTDKSDWKKDSLRELKSFFLKKKYGSCNSNYLPYIFDIQQEGEIQYIFVTQGHQIPYCFDINCTMISLECFDGRFSIQYDNEFEKFLNHKEIMLDSFHITTKSILRAIKKSKELKVKFDFEFHYNLLLVLKTQTSLNELKSEAAQAELLYEKSAKVNYRLRALLTNIPRHLDSDKWHNLCFQIIALDKKQKSIIYRLPGLLLILPRFRFYFNFNLIDINRSDKSLSQLNDFFVAQPEFIATCFYKKILCSELKKLANHKDKDKIVGFYEHNTLPTESHSTYFKLNWKNIDNAINFKSENLKDPEQLPNIFINSCKELVTKSDLLKEGTELHHCVSGYSQEVQNNNVLIFSIQTNSGRSTLSLYYLTGKINQHKSYCNQNPCDENVKIAKELSNYFISIRN